MLAFIGGIGRIELFFLLVFILTPFILWVWALVDVLRSRFKDSSTKLIWVVVIILMPFIGALLYLALGRRRRVSDEDFMDI